MSKKDSNDLLEPVSAVASYLDNLLQEEPPASPPVALKEKVVPLPGVRPLDELLAEVPPPPEEPADPAAAQEPPEQVESTPPPEPPSAVEETPEPEVEDQPETQAAAPEEPRQRYRFPVQCLMFQVAGHDLCIPLIDMGSVAPLNREAMTRLPDSPPWLLGVLPHRGQNLRIVDSAVLLGIEGHPMEAETLHFLVFADEDFAITCEGLGQVVYLQDEEIKWLPPDSGGLSMGTVRESLATLLSPVKIRQRMAALSSPN